jgi:hypothetical protein
MLLEIFTHAMALSQQSGQLELKKTTCELLSALSLTCKTFCSLVATIRRSHTTALIKGFMQLNDTFPLSHLDLTSLKSYNQAARYYDQISKEFHSEQISKELHDKTRRLFPESSLYPLPQRQPFIENRNLLEIYGLITSHIQTFEQPLSETEDNLSSAQKLLSAHASEIKSLFSNRLFLTLLFRSCSFVPSVFLEKLSEIANQDEVVFNTILQQAARYSHAEVVSFLLSRKDPTIVVNTREISHKMALPRSLPLPELAPVGSSSLGAKIAALPPETPTKKRLEKRTFKESVTNIYFQDLDTFIKDLLFIYENRMGHVDIAKDQIALLLEVSLSFTHKLNPTQWAQLLDLAKTFNEKNLLEKLLLSLTFCHRSFPEQATIHSLYPILKRIVRDAILEQNTSLLTPIKQILSLDVLAQFIAEYHAHYESTHNPGMLDYFQPFIQEHVLR